jgi:hypothetical protein
VGDPAKRRNPQVLIGLESRRERRESGRASRTPTLLQKDVEAMDRLTHVSFELM